VDTDEIAFKCTCPSRQFPCKHAIGLLLLANNDTQDSENMEEPEWVIEWLDKRKAKKEGKPNRVIDENVQKPVASKEKTQNMRLESVLEGVRELEFWLQDLIRLGLLELPQKPTSYFERTAARMVDAKAPGLAGWIWALANLNYQQQDWEDNALKIISKLYLLLQAIKKYDTLDPIWKTTIRNLAGWNQSSKELLADPNANTLKDQWLVIGQLTEENKDITVQRSFLVGCRSGHSALILNFSTRYSDYESIIVPGMVMEGDFAYFPSVSPKRGIFKIIKESFHELKMQPNYCADWEAVMQMKNEALQINPWSNDHIFFIEQVRLYDKADLWCVLDGKNIALPVHTSVELDKCLKWLVLTGNDYCNLAAILRNELVIPLGILYNDQYFIL